MTSRLRSPGVGLAALTAVVATGATAQELPPPSQIALEHPLTAAFVDGYATVGLELTGVTQMQTVFPDPPEPPFTWGEIGFTLRDPSDGATEVLVRVELRRTQFNLVPVHWEVVEEGEATFVAHAPLSAVVDHPAMGRALTAAQDHGFVPSLGFIEPDRQGGDRVGVFTLVFLRDSRPRADSIEIDVRADVVSAGERATDLTADRFVFSAKVVVP